MKSSKIFLISSGILLALLILMFGMPYYWVWSSGMHGRAALNKASYNRQVMVVEAKAAAEAAGWYKMRDTVQAQGVAITNAIIGNSLKENQPYLVFKWLETLKEMKGAGQVIYVPGGMSPLPVTEATRLQQPIK